MGKLTQQELSEEILYNYSEIEDIEDNSKEVLERLENRVRNDKATKVSYVDYKYDIFQYSKFLAKVMCDLNPKLKSLLIKNDSTYDNPYFMAGNYPEEILEINRRYFKNGIYYSKTKFKGKDIIMVLRIYQKQIKKSSDNDDTDNDDYDNSRTNVDIYTVGKHHKKYMDKIISDVNKMLELDKLVKNDIIITVGKGTQTRKETVFKTFDQFIIKDKQDILNYINNWLDNINIYQKYNLIPKLSILIYGDPGTGKSTFAKALAKYIGTNTVVIYSPEYFSSEKISRDSGRMSIRSEGSDFIKAEPEIITLDDIDCYVNSREIDNSSENNEKMSNLLEFLDNPPLCYIKSKKDEKYYPASIVVATTNYIDKLDKAIKRYGRFDLKIEMQEFTIEQAEEMCQAFDLHFNDIYKEKIKDKKAFRISPAYLQSLCSENIEKIKKGSPVEILNKEEGEVHHEETSKTGKKDN